MLWVHHTTITRSHALFIITFCLFFFFLKQTPYQNRSHFPQELIERLLVDPWHPPIWLWIFDLQYGLRLWKSLRLRIHLVRFNQFTPLSWYPLSFRYVFCWMSSSDFFLFSIFPALTDHILLDIYHLPGLWCKCWTVGHEEKRKPIQQRVLQVNSFFNSYLLYYLFSHY